MRDHSGIMYEIQTCKGTPNVIGGMLADQEIARVFVDTYQAILYFIRRTSIN